VQEGKLVQENKARQEVNQTKESTSTRQKSISVTEIRKSVKIAAHNINGLKGNRHKLDILIDKFEEDNYDIVGVIETNITKKEG
jgi:hypothetical protein